MGKSIITFCKQVVFTILIVPATLMSYFASCFVDYNDANKPVDILTKNLLK